MKAEITVQDGEFVLSLPDELYEELNLQISDVFTCYHNNYGKMSFRRTNETSWEYVTNSN